MLKMAEINDLILKYRKSLRIEVWKASKPKFFLEIRQPSGMKTLGRIPKSVFKRPDVMPMDAQPGFINVAWYKFSQTKIV